jgi:hypothetical protein
MHIACLSFSSQIMAATRCSVCRAVVYLQRCVTSQTPLSAGNHGKRIAVIENEFGEHM